MSDMLTALLTAGALPQSGFGTSSRYYGVPILELESADGSTLRYVGRRFIPQVELFTSLISHRVQQGDRIDVLAARYLGDPLLYWRIADANLAVRPSDPLIAGKVIKIPGAARLPGALL
jgi:nucleoid-associated protein YgaU